MPEKVRPHFHTPPHLDFAFRIFDTQAEILLTETVHSFSIWKVKRETRFSLYEVFRKIRLATNVNLKLKYLRNIYRSRHR